ncbi:MAG: hypothetical protein QOF44_1546 [Streptomyces sp.]|nr:hypothetical protein [Streptomyces sp.]
MSHGIITPYEGSGHPPWDPSVPAPAPLRLHRTTVRREWVDYNGHLSESCFLLVFGDGSDAFFRCIGVDEEYRAAGRLLELEVNPLLVLPEGRGVLAVDALVRHGRCGRPRRGIRRRRGDAGLYAGHRGRCRGDS